MQAILPQTATLSQTEARVLLVCRRLADRCLYPSAERVAAKLGTMSRYEARLIRDRLVDAGLLTLPEDRIGRRGLKASQHDEVLRCAEAERAAFLAAMASPEGNVSPGGKRLLLDRLNGETWDHLPASKAARRLCREVRKAMPNLWRAGVPT